jgi:sensor histidine kinase YesM
MVERINDISLLLLEAICYWIFFSAIFNREAKQRPIFRAVFLISLFLILTVMTEIFSEVIVLKLFLIIALMSFAVMVYYQATFKDATMAAFGCMLLFVAMDFLTLLFFQLAFGETALDGLYSATKGRLLVLIEKICVLIIVMYLKVRSNRRQNRGLMETEWIRFMLFPFFTLFSTVAVYLSFENIQNERQAGVLYAIIFGLIMMNVLIFVLIDDVIRREKNLKQKELAYAQYQRQVELYQSLEKGLERQKQFAHEYRNHLTCIHSLIQDQKYAEANAYIDKISPTSGVESPVLDVNHNIVNTILNEKYYEMQRKGILFVFRMNDLSGLKIEDNDLVVLLSNLLNNAIEACEKCDEKMIRLRFEIEEDSVILSVWNTTTGQVQIDQGTIKSSKEDDWDEHGYGIPNVRETILKYGGNYSMESNDKEFCFSIVIPKRNAVRQNSKTSFSA